MDVLKTGKLPWITDKEFINGSDCVPTEIVGVASSRCRTECGCVQDVVFTNFEDYKDFSPIFKYKFNSSNMEFEPYKLGDPFYFKKGVSSNRYLSSTSICGMLLLFKDYCGCPTFELRDICTGYHRYLKIRCCKKEQVCQRIEYTKFNKDCGIKNCMCNKFKKKYQVVCTKKVNSVCRNIYEDKNPYSNFEYSDNIYDELVEIVKSKVRIPKHRPLSIRGVATMENQQCLIFGFQVKKKLILLQIKYVVDNKYLVLLPTDCKVDEYHLPSAHKSVLQVCDIIFDSCENRLLVLSKSSKGGYLHQIKWLPSFRSFNVSISAALKGKCSTGLFTDMLPNTFTHLGCGIYMIIYSNCMGNYFSYELVKLKN